MLIIKYCEYLINFYLIKTQFLKSAFTEHSSNCDKNFTNGLKYSSQLYNFIEIHNDFVNDMKRGCNKGGNNTKCRIYKSNINDILQEFNESYYNYKKNPEYMCTIFAEFSK